MTSTGSEKLTGKEHKMTFEHYSDRVSNQDCIELFNMGAASRDDEIEELNQQINLMKLSTPALDSIGIVSPSPRVLMENYRKVLEERHNAATSSLEQECVQLRRQITFLQSRIDELMLEFCPNDMTKEQLDNWAAHQRAVPEDELPEELK